MLNLNARPVLALCAALPLLQACFGPGNLHPSELTGAERAVKVYHQGEKPPCEYDELGIVEATSGSSFEMGTYESSLARLQREAAAKDASGVIVIDHSKNQMADQATGKAIRCQGPTKD